MRLRSIVSAAMIPPAENLRLGYVIRGNDVVLDGGDQRVCSKIRDLAESERSLLPGAGRCDFGGHIDCQHGLSAGSFSVGGRMLRDGDNHCP